MVCRQSYHIQRDSVKLKRSGRTINTYSYFSNINANNWKHSAKYVNDAVEGYSEWLEITLYDVCKSVDGALSAGAGMEYPTITGYFWRWWRKSLDSYSTMKLDITGSMAFPWQVTNV